MTRHHAGGYADFSFVQQVYDYLPYLNARKDIEFFVELAREAGGPVLELGSGTGRILLPTARAGVQISGLDLSPHMLAACREALAHEASEVAARVKLIEGDMRSFNLPERFQLINIPFYSFQHLTEAVDQIACLEACHLHLEARGRLVINNTNPSLPRILSEKSFEEIQTEPEFTIGDGRKVIRRVRDTHKDLVNQVITSEFIYSVSDSSDTPQQLVHELKMRYAFTNELEHLLARTGFAIEAVYEDFAKTPYGTKHSIKEVGWSAGELIIVARKASI